MYFRTLEICVIKYMKSIRKISFSSWISMASSFKKTKVNLDLLTDIDKFLMANDDEEE